MTVSQTAPTSTTLEDLGPVDFVVLEFPHRREPGDGLPILVDLVDRGLVRVLDIVFIRKEADGSVRRVELRELGPSVQVFEGASSGMIDAGDIDNAAAVIDPDSAACLLVYENHWAAPLVGALRKNGAQVVASVRLSLDSVLASLDASEKN